ncbi:MAG: glycosyltransferase family 2 protein [Deltaproteobacteria bacterium]|jgi:glycosyltransferase involved in cell wall biosynthesis|nr:glycosyltransferase family 2 protein [Deltaproteobacteria bacterium]
MKSGFDMKLSVAVMSFNEEANIRRALESVLPVADEIVLVDSFSTDKTVVIAEELGARVFREEWKGYIDQTNSCLEKCRGEWVLCLDCDEEVSPELLDSVRRVLELPAPAAGYLLNRRSFYLGRLLKYAWQPDHKLRLARRACGLHCEGNNPHPVLKVNGRVERCAGDLLHYSYKDFGAHMAQTQNFARQIAATHYKNGRRSGWFSLLFKPPFAFFRSYILRRAFMDGVPGLLAAVSSAVYSYMKYAFLWEMHGRNRPGAKSE